MGAFVVPSIFTAVDKMTAPLRKMTSSVQSFTSRASAGVSRLDRNLRKLTPSLGGIGRQMLAFASVGVLISGIGGAISTIKDYEQANADLAAVMNTTTANQTDLRTDAERLGAVTAKSASEVVGLQEAYARLGFSTSEIIDMTEGTIAGSVAMNAELAETAELTGAMVRTFDDFSSADAPAIMDMMTLATQKSALNFTKLQTALPIVAGAANAAGIPFNQLTALLGKLSDAGIDASSSSTALRNIFLESAKQGLGYEEILTKIAGSQDKLTRSNDEFGKRAAVPAAILAKTLIATSELSEEIDKAAHAQEGQGAAAKAAAVRLDTFQGSLTLLSSAWEGLLLDMNKATGGLGSLKTIIQFVTNNIKTIASIIIHAVGAFVALKVAVIAGQIALGLYNVAVGVAAVFTTGLTKSIALNNIQLIAYKVAATLATVATWAWNAATTALAFAMQFLMSPITLIILAIAALAAGVYFMITAWDEFGKVIAFALGPIGMMISFIQSLISNWAMVTEAFESNGIVSAILAIGKILVDALISPVQQLLELISLIPGLSIAGDLAQDLADFRTDLGVNVEANKLLEKDPVETAPAINPKSEEQGIIQQRIEEINKGQLDININDEKGRAETSTSGTFDNINILSTLQFGQ